VVSETTQLHNLMQLYDPNKTSQFIDEGSNKFIHSWMYPASRMTCV